MKNLQKIIIASFLIFLGSCESMIDVQPRQSIDSTLALQGTEAFNAALNGVYARLRDVNLYGRDIIAIPELLADNATNTGAGNRLVNQSFNQPGAHISNWFIGYITINQINLMLEAVETNDFTTSYKNDVKGQLHFIRGLIYFEMARVYGYDPTAILTQVDNGAVPILEKGVLAVEDITYPRRASIAEIYAYIYNELETAAGLLQNLASSRAPHYASDMANSAIFSRVALYNGDYQKVIVEADKVLANSRAVLTNSNNFIAGWRSEVHPESIFEIVFTAPDNLGSNESLRATFTTRLDVNGATPVSFGNVVVSESLYNAYDNNDLRKSLILPGLGNNANEMEMTKFFSKNGLPNLDNVPVIRTAEVLLNKAEAHARLGQNQQALDALNMIRERVGLEPYENISDNELIEAILNERRLELAFEGHRFFDLKRLGRDIVKEFGVIPFDDFRILNNIPQREIELNSNLVQNRGF
ncbi:RagB/SusD family nutrient uptake outer membrane protein [Belliella kenyensis]|uniref:RagB/SusD family nutrient uptake outer membrane protein n=1 Tax=Belliella kenyensis TaxID=1472724 RepID=A0ABV8ELH9_9BACT|nr:RagB/SusD family nutrient uptake outer membrane protein [Belliella kenyensis]MCH7401429.1 RagB/SusD family nutrient uptake outer membrane protein [Belliella kenyensis]MDN3602872.1 RagB/SusD family nutrient uptake outer membrane protein [Belliella kenyensis]